MSRRARNERREVLFVRLGLWFIIFVPIALTMLTVKNEKIAEQRASYPGAKAVADGGFYYHFETCTTRGIRSLYRDSEKWEIGGLRNQLLSELTNPSVYSLSEKVLCGYVTREELKLVRTSLKHRPEELRYNIDCIRLIGILDEYLDNPEICATIE